MPGLLEGVVALGEFGQANSERGAGAAREVAGLVLSHLSGDPANADAIMHTPGAVRMLATCLIAGCTLEGTTAAKALSNFPLSEPPAERSALAHTREQWFIHGTDATNESPPPTHPYCCPYLCPYCTLTPSLLTGSWRCAARRRA